MQPNKHFIEFLTEFRKYVRALLLATLCCTAGLYILSPILLQGLQAHLGQKLAFFTVAEPFLAHIKLSFLVTIFALMPAIIYSLWRATAKPFGLPDRTMQWFVFFTCLLFYAGASFCYLITLPFGIKFLLGFQSVQLKPIISIGKFVTFVAMFILAFGAIFELPILMVFCAKVGLCPLEKFKRHRRYAILVISILAAMLTPTPDIVNMLLMGIPLYLLYELGIIALTMLKFE